jgi:hypothetical protein
MDQFCVQVFHGAEVDYGLRVIAKSLAEICPALVVQRCFAYSQNSSSGTEEHHLVGESTAAF